MDYSNGKIYKITNNVNDEVYVGSTTQSLIKRFSYHKKDCFNPKKEHLKIYECMREIGPEHFCITLIEDYKCSNKTELRLREGFWIRELGTLNDKIAGRNAKQYYQENIEKIKAYCSENKDKRNDYNKNWFINNSEKRQQYLEENRETRLARSKLYREQNKEKIKLQRNEKIECECGLRISRANIAVHKKTGKHLRLISSEQIKDGTASNGR